MLNNFIKEAKEDHENSKAALNDKQQCLVNAMQEKAELENSIMKIANDKAQAKKILQKQFMLMKRQFQKLK